MIPEPRPQQPNPLVERYLDQLASALAGRGVSPEEQAGIRGDIESHVAEATSRGERLADVLERLGPAERLAGAYASEELFHPRWARHPGAPPLRLWAGRAVALATVSVAALLGLLLAVTGAVLTVVGALGALAGLVGPVLPLDPTLRAGWPQLVVVVLSLALAAAGIAVLRLARWNLGALRERRLHTHRLGKP